jgi:hypothetical protein
MDRSLHKSSCGARCGAPFEHQKEKLRFEAPWGFGGMRWPRKVKEKKFVIKPRGHRRPPKPFGYFSVMKSDIKKTRPRGGTRSEAKAGGGATWTARTP